MFDAIGEMPRAIRARAPNTTRKAIVVGAGLAGLACAERLLRGGWDVNVLEAADRVGGRVRSMHDFIPGAVLEAGAEFIGRNHPRWLSYAKRFGIPLVKADEYPNQDGPILLRGQLIEKNQARRLWRDSNALLRRLNAPARDIDADQPWLSPGADQLDRISLGQWIDSQRDIDEDARAVAAIAMAGDNGLGVERQSLLANLAMIKGGGLDSFWTDCEYYRAEGGNDRLAFALARVIGTDRIRLNAPVVRIDTHDAIARAECADGTIFEAEDVVLATSASVYRKIKFDPPLPRKLEVQMGQTLKIMAHVKTNFWIEDRNAPEGLSDGWISQMWDGTDGQPGARGASLNALCLTTPATAAAAVGRDRRPHPPGNDVDDARFQRRAA